ncbi:MAG: helix-turn-helix domain-containing protein [Oscillospiraceae bacterium]|nr:helix-turn-helix domain-containing protein [Oscillospiraceae bacterium]
MNNLYIIKDRLNEAMQKRGITAAELAQRTGLNKSSVSRYLTGENIPRSLAIGKLAQALRVNPAWILGYDVAMEEGVEPIHIEIDKLSDINKEKLLAYYQALIDSQEG